MATGAGTAGIVASGHADTSAAACEVLAAGGNAFDAALAALAASTVCEPMLTSLGGGGYLMARPAGQAPVLFDFFVQTPAQKQAMDRLDFYPILADFGTAKQEFHVGLGAMAVPGMVAGLFAVHERLGSLPMAEILAPAISLARRGVIMTPYQANLNHVLQSIIEISPAATALVAPQGAPERPARTGERVCNMDLADTLELLVREGAGGFYQGEPGQQLVADCAARGGLLTQQDLDAYQVVCRRPLTVQQAGATLYLNPPPSPGGTLIALTLGLLAPLLSQFDDEPLACRALAGAIAQTNALRDERELADLEAALDAPQLAALRALARPADVFSRGTTHLSVADAAGNLVSLTTSNGEGTGYVIPHTGVMMNNMLGEQDLNPQGFHRWQPNSRLASMMCPTVVRFADGSELALGSGGSNRIRSAIAQVLLHRLRGQASLRQAVAAPRLHLEGQQLSFEAGFSAPAVAALKADWPRFEAWPSHCHFFGGVHAVERGPEGALAGAGDPRRDGRVGRQSDV